MEVSGKKQIGKQDITPCKPCQDRNLFTRADGFCGECEEHMCNACFDTHKTWKLNKGHTLINSNEKTIKREQTEDLQKCDQHLKEMIKFFCPKHERVGCGDCMVLDHKTCKVEYILDKARTFKDSREFKEMVKGAEKCHAEAKKLLSSIKDNKVQVVDINEKFNQDVNMLKDEIMSHVTKMANTMLRQGRDVMEIDMERMNALEKDIEGMINELSVLTEEFESQIDRPNKLFVNSVLQKPKLKRLRDQIDSMKGKNKIDMYEFKRGDNLERLVKECKELGSIMKQRTEMDLHQQQEVRPKKTKQIVQASPKAQPLLERQLICKNITMDGEYLSYLDNGSGDVGLYVDKKCGGYFEVELTNLGQNGTIGIGLVPRYYSENHLPGRGKNSIGFDVKDGKSMQFCIKMKGLRARVNDVKSPHPYTNGCESYSMTYKMFMYKKPSSWLYGKLYYESDTGKKFGPKCNVGDRIGCGLIEEKWHGSYSWYAVFTRNGEKVIQMKLQQREKFIYAYSR